MIKFFENIPDNETNLNFFTSSVRFCAFNFKIGNSLLLFLTLNRIVFLNGLQNYWVKKTLSSNTFPKNLKLFYRLENFPCRRANFCPFNKERGNFPSIFEIRLRVWLKQHLQEWYQPICTFRYLDTWLSFLEKCIEKKFCSKTFRENNSVGKSSMLKQIWKNPW